MIEKTKSVQSSKRNFIKDDDLESRQLNLIEITENDQEKLMQHVADSVVGNLEPFYSVYGIRRTIYCDYTASGKALSFIEDYIRDQGE